MSNILAITSVLSGKLFPKQYDTILPRKMDDDNRNGSPAERGRAGAGHLRAADYNPPGGLQNEFRASPNSPLHSESELGMLRFYAPDARYRVEATVQLTPEAVPFDMPTYNGKTQSQVKYAVLSFVLNGQQQTLAIYRSLTLTRLPQYRDYLFLPFKDATSGKETYAGGRYLDLRLGEIHDGRLMLDFNKAYNPYCAYADGYSCPIPPKENELTVAIEAGEQKYGKGH